MSLLWLGIWQIAANKVESFREWLPLYIQLLKHQELLGLVFITVAVLRLFLYLVGDLNIYGIDSPFEQFRETLDSFITAEDIVEVENHSFSDLVHPQVVPLTPSSIVS